MEEQQKKLIEESIRDAVDKGLFQVVEARPPIKQRLGGAKIAICVPIGDKDDPDLFVCPDCGYRHFGVVRCQKCGHDHSAKRKLHVGGLVPFEFAMSMIQHVPPLLCSTQIIYRKGILSAQARNEMTYAAIQSGCKYIVYIDDDVLFPSRGIYDMHRILETHPEAAAVSGVYTTKEDCMEPLYYQQHGEGAFWDMTVEPGVIEPIFGAGAGFMMARTEALEDVERILGGPWWYDEHEPEESHVRTMWGHDIRFFRRLWETWQSTDGYGPGPHGTEDPKKKGLAHQQWKVYGAGWIQCIHWDYKNSRGYAMPPDSPCFKNKNTKNYWENVWESTPIMSQTLFPEVDDAVCDVLPHEAKVIDFGCGIGVLMEKMLKRKHAYVRGLDFSEQAVMLTRERELPADVADAATFELNGDCNDSFFTCTQTIEFLDDEKLENLFKQAAKCRTAIFTTIDGGIPGGEPGVQQQVFDSNNLKDKLSNHFSLVEVQGVESNGRKFLIAFGSNQPQSEDECSTKGNSRGSKSPARRSPPSPQDNVSSSTLRQLRSGQRGRKFVTA